jgi:hypothetical protein
MKLLSTKFVGTSPGYMCAKIKFVGEAVFENNMFKAKVDGNANAYKRI